jgi:uncharacterized protein DUF4342
VTKGGIVPVKKNTSKKSTKSKSKSKTNYTETFKVTGEEMLKKVKQIVKEGNVRRITIKDKKGKTLIVIPLTLGVVGMALAPILAAVGAIAALVTECSITVEREK